MIEEARIHSDEDGWHIRIGGDLFEEATEYLADSGATELDSQISDEALAALDESLGPWREHRAEGEAVRRERAATGGLSYAEAHAVDDPHERAREQADTVRDLARGK